MSAPAVESLERTGHEVLERARRRVQPLLEEQVSLRLSALGGVAAYHLGWQEADGARSQAGCGKTVRPALCFAAAEAVGASADAARTEAAAVQLVHDFSLLHDDLIDGDRTRRHRPAVWASFGLPAGVLCGDALVATALAAVASASGEAAGFLAETVVELVEGEALDVAFEQRARVSPQEYVAMAGAKTGALMGCACRLGALAGGADRLRAAQLAAFGRELGVAFQIADDLLGLYGEEAATGKPVGSDLASRKKSLPILAALAADTSSGRELAALYGQSGPMSEADVAHAARLVHAAGGVDIARRYAADALRRARTALDEARPTAHGREHLTALAHVLTHRDR
ncbi:polyprenyl synthetase family protein [Streptomyces sp. ODS28]|uniref:polyprenyl synthetase family protein n=1 Tax=Streptomyces sp. ODS28 TaxID=3136688 RepID=UPI0031ED726B